MSNQIAKKKEKITDLVLQRVLQKQMDGSIHLPSNYSAQNAMMAAYLILQETKNKNDESVLATCTQPSIANALMNMVVQGLNPNKQQCYFIPYGKTLTMQRSYLGTIAVTKRLEGVKDVKGYPVYKDDKFELDFDILTGKQTIKEYKPTTNRNEKDLIGAFALIIGEEDILHVEWMTMDQIKKAWNQGQMKGNSGAHKNFPDQMAIKTVINRACKTYAKTSDDSGLITSMLTQQTDEEVEVEIAENANVEILESEEVDEKTYIDPETGEVLEEELAEPKEVAEPQTGKAPF